MIQNCLHPHRGVERARSNRSTNSQLLIVYVGSELQASAALSVGRTTGSHRIGSWVRTRDSLGTIMVHGTILPLPKLRRTQHILTLALLQHLINDYTGAHPGIFSGGGGGEG
jgi:hypothetical protein